VTAVHPDGEAILNAIRRGDQSMWWVHHFVMQVESATDQDGCPVVVFAKGDGAADGGMAIGLAVARDGGWYLGCIECRNPVAEQDAGMCPPCHERAGLSEHQADGP